MASESQDQFNISSERLRRPLGEHSLLASLTPDRNVAFSRRLPIHILTKHNPASLQFLVCIHPQNVGNSSTCLAKHLKPTAAVSQLRGYIQIQMQPRNTPFISLAIKDTRNGSFTAQNIPRHDEMRKKCQVTINSFFLLQMLICILLRFDFIDSLSFLLCT